MMRQIVLNLDDEAFEPFMGLLALCQQVQIVGESEVTDVLNNRDQCMKQAIETLRENKVFKHGYDFAWIMVAINQGVLDAYEGFRSPQAFLDYLYEIGIDNLPSRYSLSRAYSIIFHTYPDWTFKDVDGATETLRRKNVVRQFLTAYAAAKRDLCNKFCNK